jgi:tRNA U38,U39,U40 pseudouridine synthase TruA
VDAYSNEAQRYILSYHCPGTIEVRGQKWARLVVLGQSFMMHQIRKMVGRGGGTGLATGVCWGCCTA